MANAAMTSPDSAMAIISIIVWYLESSLLRYLPQTNENPASKITIKIAIVVPSIAIKPLKPTSLIEAS